MTYEIKLSIKRSDHPEASLDLDLPCLTLHSAIWKNNAVLWAAKAKLDACLSDLPKAEGKET